MYVDYSKVHKGGKGLFARVTIRKGDVVCWYSGRVVTAKELESMPRNRWVADVELENGETGGLDSSDLNNFSGRWANHSKANFNAKMLQAAEGIDYDSESGLHYVVLVATKDISVDDEIFTDYSEKYFVLPNGKIDPIYNS